MSRNSRVTNSPARPEPVPRNGRGHNSERPAYHHNNNNNNKKSESSVGRGFALYSPLREYGGCSCISKPLSRDPPEGRGLGSSSPRRSLE